MTLTPQLRNRVALGLALLGFLGAWWWMQRHFEKPPTVVSRPPITFRPTESGQQDTPNPAKEAEATRDHRTAEVIWRIRDDVDRAHLDRAIANGLRVTGRIGPLGLVKVSGPLDLLRQWSKPSMEAGLNVPVAVPRLPDIPALDGARPFQDKLLDFFGLEDRSADWGKGIRIAVLDTGISAHPALADAHLNAFGEASDDNGHGTAVASLIAGNDTYAKGLAPAADLFIYKVLDVNGVGDAFGIAAAIVSATDRGAQLISLSAGSTDDSSLLREAVDYANAHDVVIVAAAGNEDATELLYPAAYEDVLAVGAVDANGAAAGFSNAGSTLNLAAPGVGIYSAYPGNQYIEFSGTSAATPIVTGAIAALASEDPFLSVSRASELLVDYSNDAGAPGWDASTGHGILDPLRVIERNAPNFSDLGVSAPYLVPETTGNDMMDVSINVQNRGNQYIASASVVIEINGTPSTHRIVGLESKASQAIVIPISNEDLHSGSGVRFEVEVITGSGQSDEREENNGYTSTLQLTPGG